MKKILSVLAAVSLAAGMLAVPASACGGGCHGGSRYTQRTAYYGACNVNNCISGGSHYHNGNAYGAHTPYCTLDDCTSDTAHIHDGVTYARHIGYCTVDSCVVDGIHLHNNIAYC